MREKNVSSPMPSARATMISELVSIVNVVRPSTSSGVRPASSRAARIASHASCSSLRPESLLNSVAPMPTIAALSESPFPAGVIAVLRG
jgi:hypothetical protein